MNTSLGRFARNLLLIDIAALALLSYPIIQWQGSEGWKALLIALVVTSANSYIGYWAILRSIKANMNTLMLTVFGGMLARMGIMLMVLAFVVVATQLPQITFTIALFIAYICKSVLEMILIHNLPTNRRS